MEDLKVYYKDEQQINEEFDKAIENLAHKFGLYFTGSGVEIKTHIRDIHFEKKR